MTVTYVYFYVKECVRTNVSFRFQKRLPNLRRSPSDFLALVALVVSVLVPLSIEGRVYSKDLASTSRTIFFNGKSFSRAKFLACVDSSDERKMQRFEFRLLSTYFIFELSFFSLFFLCDLMISKNITFLILLIRIKKIDLLEYKYLVKKYYI